MHEASRSDVPRGAPARTIDFHAHYLPPEVLGPDAFRRTGPAVVFTMGGLRVGPVPAAVLDLAEQWDTLARSRFERRVLSLPPFALGDHWSGEDGVDYARAANEALGRVSRESGGRFLALATVPLDAPGRSAEVMREAVEVHGLRGVEICSYNGRRELDDAALGPFWDAAEALGLPVMIHPNLTADPRMTAYYLQNLVGNPLETALATARLVFGNVLARHPGLLVVLSHGGGAFPFLVGRLQRGAEVRPECQGALAPRDALRRVYVDSVVFDPVVLRALLTLVPADHVVLGSDSPFSMSERDALATVEGAVPPGPDRDAILAGTAARLLRDGLR